MRGFRRVRILAVERQLPAFESVGGVVQSKAQTPKELANLITFKKNKKIGIKIKKIGAIILKKTIKELDSLINDEFKKT